MKDEHLDRALDNLLALQHDDGCWEGEMVWCTMILSQYVIVQHLAGRKWDDATRAGIIRHYEVTRRIPRAPGDCTRSPQATFSSQPWRMWRCGCSGCP